MAMSLYLVPNTEGSLEGNLKERIIDHMMTHHVGFMHACQECKVPMVRAWNEYRADKNFAEAVDTATDMLVTWHSEEILNIADETKSKPSRESVAGISLRVQVRERMRDALLPRWREGKKGQSATVHQHLHTGENTTYVTLSPERQKELREQRERIAATTKDTAPRELPVADRGTGLLVQPTERK